MFQDFKAILPPFSLIIIGALLGVFVHPAFFMVCVFGLADTFGRYQDYWYLMSQYFDEKEGECNIPVGIADYYGRSRCGRWLVGTCDSWYRDNEFWYDRGYRWWHFLPRGFPAILLKRRFWHNLLKGHEK